MSDIQINLDGLIAFLVAAALALVFALALVVVSLRALIRARRGGQQFSRQRAFPHACGMLLSISCCAAVMLVVWFADQGATPHTLNQWLDRLTPLWGALIVALAPVASRLVQSRQQFARAVPPRV